MTLGNFYYKNSQKDEIEKIINDFNQDLEAPDIVFWRSYSRDWFSLAITGEVDKLAELSVLLPKSIF